MTTDTITRIAILAPLPYSLSRLVWAAGVPLGIEAGLLARFDSPGHRGLGVRGRRRRG